MEIQGHHLSFGIMMALTWEVLAISKFMMLQQSQMLLVLELLGKGIR